jgi:cytochrome c oxidase cbb3-type subunit I/II
MPVCCVATYNLVKTMKQGRLMPTRPLRRPRSRTYVAIKGELAQMDRAQAHADARSDLSCSWPHRWYGRDHPTALIESNVPTIATREAIHPARARGRDVYIREGCNNCHSQMIRPFRSETERYGEYSKAGEFVYDRPFLWGSKRTGPDLHRWHYHHMIDPGTLSPGTIMPSYPWLEDKTVNADNTAKKIKAMRTLGVPYPEGYEDQAVADMQKQAQEFADRLKNEGVEVLPESEMVALIAYLQRLGTDIKK